MWSRTDPVTLFGARVSKTSSTDVAAYNEQLGGGFRDCSSYEIELVAAGASGDLAYTVAYEKTTASVRGGPVVPYTLRVTHVYRQEQGEWRLIHRHADSVPEQPDGDPSRYCSKQAHQSASRGLDGVGGWIKVPRLTWRSPTTWWGHRRGPWLLRGSPLRFSARR